MRAGWRAVSRFPIVHVNADDPEACVEAARLACGYRERFQRDFLIDLIGYRRLRAQRRGRARVHAAADVPEDRVHPTVREQWARTLEERGEIARRARPTSSSRNTPRTAASDGRAASPSSDFVEPQPASRTAGGRVQGRNRASPIDRLREMNDALLRRCRTASPSTASSNACARSARRCSTAPTSGRSTGRPPRSSRSRRFSPTGSASG